MPPIHAGRAEPLLKPTSADMTDHYCKRWCLTLNNYTDADIAKFKEKITEDRMKFAVVGKEVGENGTRHLQGFLHFKDRIRMHQIKALLSLRMHLEMARGTDL